MTRDAAGHLRDAATKLMAAAAAMDGKPDGPTVRKPEKRKSVTRQPRPNPVRVQKDSLERALVRAFEVEVARQTGCTCTMNSDFRITLNIIDMGVKLNGLPVNWA